MGTQLTTSAVPVTVPTAGGFEAILSVFGQSYGIVFAFGIVMQGVPSFP